MSGTPLIAKLLATTALQGSDLVPLKGQNGISQPDLITDIEALANDSRLPSRAAIGRQLGVATGQPGSLAGAAAVLASSDNASLSVTARLISDIMRSAPIKSDAVAGTVPVWTETSAPVASLLAAALAQNVDASGLFYESHLLQFFSGQRSLEQLRQEPQASRSSFDGDGDDGVGGDDATSSSVNVASRTDVSHGLTAMPVEVMPLVRQQLELLALSQFRWLGEAWPRARMEWEITQQEQRQENHASAEETLRCTWSSSITLTLPRLGAVVLRLSLVDASWKLELAAAETTTINSMRAESAQLRQRFLAADLPLSGLQVVQLPQSNAEQQA